MYLGFTLLVSSLYVCVCYAQTWLQMSFSEYQPMRRADTCVSAASCLSSSRLIWRMLMSSAWLVAASQLSITSACGLPPMAPHTTSRRSSTATCPCTKLRWQRRAHKNSHFHTNPRLLCFSHRRRHGVYEAFHINTRVTPALRDALCNGAMNISFPCKVWDGGLSLWDWEASKDAGREGWRDRKNMLLSVQHPPVYKSGVEWPLFTPQHGANALTEMMLMHYTGSCPDIFKAAAEGCDGLPLRPTPVIPEQTHSC